MNVFKSLKKVIENYFEFRKLYASKINLNLLDFINLRDVNSVFFFLNRIIPLIYGLKGLRIEL